jgi:hypothetical protein
MERRKLFPPRGRSSLPVAVAPFLTGSFCLAQDNNNQGQSNDGLVYTVHFGADGSNNRLQLYALFGRGATNFSAGLPPSLKLWRTSRRDEFRLRPADAGRISQSGGLGKLTGLHNGRLRFEGKWRRSFFL